MIEAINVTQRLFGGALRAGDLLAACNFLEYIRKENNKPNLKLYIPDASVYNSKHCMQMRDFLLDVNNGGYLSSFPDQILNMEVIPGTDPTYSDMYNLFNIRRDVLTSRQNIFTIPDAISIPSFLPKEKKIVVVPLMDAPYNISRNWTLKYLQDIIDTWTHKNEFIDEFILASKDIIPGLNIGNFVYCHDYIDNIEHILDCSVYIGGDTGLSHLAGSLNPRPKCIFHYPSNTYGTTNPFYWKTLGNMIYY